MDGTGTGEEGKSHSHKDDEEKEEEREETRRAVLSPYNRFAASSFVNLFSYILATHTPKKINHM